MSMTLILPALQNLSQNYERWSVGYKGVMISTSSARSSNTTSRRFLKGAWTGPTALCLTPHALAPVAELPVLEVVSAIHIVADLTLGLGKVVHDYVRTERRSFALTTKARSLYVMGRGDWR